VPDLGFNIRGVDSAERGLVPLLNFRLEITNEPATDTVQSVLLQAQIQIQCPRRLYTDGEKEKLRELFGPPDQWGNTLRNKLWTHASAVVPMFTGRVEANLSVPCSYDLNIAATKYFYALEEREVPLLFLFSGTIFYSDSEGWLQISRISWEKECEYSIPIDVWRELMERHYPNSAWITLERDVFDQLYEFKRQNGLATWEKTVERLLADDEARIAVSK
jgi:hypothetical protein